jgi:hypothetical protein
LHEAFDGRLTVYASTGSFPDFSISATRLDTDGEILDQRAFYRPLTPPGLIAVTSDGGVATFSAINGSNGTQYQLSRFGSDLTLQWRRIYDFGSKGVWLNAFDAQGNGSFAVTGYWTSDSGVTSGWAMQISSTGNVVWNLEFADRLRARGYANTSIAAPNGDTLIAGVAYLWPPASADVTPSMMWLAAIDASGGTRWIRQLQRNSSSGNNRGLSNLLWHPSGDLMGVGVVNASGEDKRAFALLRMSALGQVAGCDYAEPAELNVRSVAADRIISDSVPSAELIAHTVVTTSVIITPIMLSMVTVCAEPIVTVTTMPELTRTPTALPSTPTNVAPQLRIMLPVILR